MNKNKRNKIFMKKWILKKIDPENKYDIKNDDLNMWIINDLVNNNTTINELYWDLIAIADDDCPIESYIKEGNRRLEFFYKFKDDIIDYMKDHLYLADPDYINSKEFNPTIAYMCGYTYFRVASSLANLIVE